MQSKSQDFMTTFLKNIIGDMASLYPKRYISHIEARENLQRMPLSEKRKSYKCGKNFKELKDIITWSTVGNLKGFNASAGVNLNGSIYKHDKTLNKKIGLFKGSIVELEIDAIVNAANSSLMGGGGVDAIIHGAAGQKLAEECRTLNGCETGEAKLTFGYNLPAKNIIHTVGPMGENPLMLENCYKNSLYVAAENKLRTVAFPCISTGVYGYPNEAAAHVALQTVRTFLEANHSNFDLIIFCIFLDTDQIIYEKLLPVYFPVN